MKRPRRRALLLLLGLAALPTTAVAQSAGAARRSPESPLAQEALAFRDKVRAAIAAKDRPTLEAAYSDNFNHLRDSGRMDYKGDRIQLLLSGEPTIESAPEENMVVQVFEPATVAV